MNKRISTLLASVLLAGSVGAFAETIAPTELKTGDVVFVKNAFDESQGSNLFSTYLKAQGDNGIVTAKQSDYVLDTKAKIDSVSWKITVRENARGEKDYKFTNVATGVVMAYDAPKQPAVVENDNYDGLATSTDSAKVVAATDKNSYWSVDAYNDTYTIAYKYHTEDGDSVVAVGAYRYTEKSEAYMVRTARVEFSSDMATSLGDLAGLTGIHIADFGQWTLDDGVEAALTAMYNIPYSELKASRIRSTNIQGLVNFQIVPVEYNAGTDKLEVVKDPKGTETTFAFLPVSQIGLDNPKYYTIDTARYNIAGKHNDAVYAYGLDTDTIIKKLDADSPKNGLRVFTLMREVGNADSIIFRPASIVKYKENATEAPYYEVEANPSNGPLTLGEYEYKTGEVVLGQAKLENTKLVSTVFAVEDERVEGILRPYAFTAPVYPNIEVGYYFIKNKAADKANADVKIYDKYYVYGLCEKDGTGYVAEPSADNSYQVWVVSGKDDKLKVQNRYTKEVLGDVLYEVGDGLYSTGNLDTLAFVTADAEKGAIDYFAIDPADINYKKFALGLVNGIGANIYVTTVADSVLGVKADDASLMLYPTIGTVTKYGVNDELLATAYTFKTKDGKVLGKVGNKYVVSKNIDAVLLFFKVAADGEYYVVESALTGTIEEQLEAEVAYLTTKATDNYLTTNT
uniref:hypothetical protein n=1 Tax=Parabacteroides sp. AM08-6 TaxID=2292053 RepID=UPI000FEF25AA